MAFDARKFMKWSGRASLVAYQQLATNAAFAMTHAGGFCRI